MTTEQKAKQLALTLVGEDQNPQPLIEALIEMAEWQKKQKQAPKGKIFKRFRIVSNCGVIKVELASDIPTIEQASDMRQDYRSRYREFDGIVIEEYYKFIQNL
jgi:bifunctional ADP-heptose synthase (sugar kinase/adenylyltransferase)